LALVRRAATTYRRGVARMGWALVAVAPEWLQVARQARSLYDALLRHGVMPVVLLWTTFPLCAATNVSGMSDASR